ncbi:MAG: aldehyde ferredoxin oxidoreductase family protein [Thermoproteales archaeon]|nr:aldehyde ferredoxin oxidoreductase family protein [Thermoproteales archaeon]
MHPNDPLYRVLYIDLTKKIYWIEDRRELFENYLGGAGVAINLLKEECPRGADPLRPENPIVFAVGPFTGLYPIASKTVAMFKSPLTGNLGESHAGGRSAIAIRMAGYGAIVIKGASKHPVYVAVHGDKVFFRDARALWGIKSSITVARIIREKEPGAGQRAIMRIGRAGENLVKYACVVTETYRHFGRLGLGAVFGSKKLKAFVVSGKRSLPVLDKRRYREIYKELFDTMVKSPLMKKYHDLGTAANVIPLNKIGALPTKNLKESKFENADKISGEYLAEKYLGRRLACAHCPVACIHLAALREPYETEPYFYKTTFISYDYELIYSLGSMLGIRNAEDMLKVLDEVEVLGLDGISSGVVLAWATEAYEKGIINENDTLGLRFKWGDYETYIKALRYIVEQPNEFYKALANGVDYAASKYGGEKFALAFGKNEMPGYHTGYLGYFGFLVGSRHSHLDMGGYSIDQKALGKEYNLDELVVKALREEEWRQILSSLVVCFFARGIYKPEIVAKALEPLGWNLTPEDLGKIGAKIHRLKYEFKFREGFDLDSLRLPHRIFETPTPHGYLDEYKFKEMIEKFKLLIQKQI